MRIFVGPPKVTDCLRGVAGHAVGEPGYVSRYVSMNIADASGRSATNDFGEPYRTPRRLRREV
jgi:hypothetical protein